MKRTNKRYNKGEKHGRAKLSNDAIHDIKTMRDRGHTHLTIANHFGVDQSRISRILSGKAWTSV